MPLTPPLAAVISDALERFAARGERRLIPRGPQEQIPYLYRNFLEGKQAPDGEPGLLLHKFVSSDKENQLHNHPWVWSVSFILCGRYRETRSAPIKREASDSVILAPPRTRDFVEGDVNYIAHDDFHRVEILTPHVWTLFLHGPRKHEWGFVPEQYGVPLTVTIVKKRTFVARKKVSRANS